MCRKSLVSCPATGGLELYLLGKNFLKETRVVFCHRQDGRTVWEDEVVPDKEFLQQVGSVYIFCSRKKRRLFPASLSIM